MDKRVDIFQLLRNEGRLEKVLVYPAISRESDPTEHTTEKIFLNPIAVKALVRNVSSEALTWRYYGLIPSESKEIIIEKKHTNLFRIASKIQIGNNYYKVLKDDSKGFSIMEKSDYSIVILSLKIN